jgi:hypothetical protein
MPSRRHLLLFTVRVGALHALITMLGCQPARIEPAHAPDAAAAGGSSSPRGGGGNGGSSGSSGNTGPGFTLPDAAVQSDRPACTPVTCTPEGGRYCGLIGDGCGGSLRCGDECPAGETCGGGGERGVCGKPVEAGCKPISCSQAQARLCGRVGDGCGRPLDCGPCDSGDTCGAVVANVCGKGTCENLCKRQVQCPAGRATTVTGTVYAPTPPAFGAADPLYNALVYVPNGQVAKFTPGVSCERCGAAVSGAPLVTALSGADGKFTLTNVPTGDNVPLVIQIGRWRRQITIPKVEPCTTVALPPELTRLPRNQSEGDIPLMAIATGTYDPLECLLRKIGVADSEFTLPTGTGRVHIFAYGGLTLGTKTPDGDLLTGSLPTLSKYDIVMLPCDDPLDKPAPALRGLATYANMGGRLFMTDWAYSWLRDGGAFQGTASWMPEEDQVGDSFVGLVDQSFPKGKAFAEWLTVVKAAGPMPGQVTINDPYGGTSYFNGVVAPTQRWISTDKPLQTTQVFSFNTPIAARADDQCGRVVYSTFHVVEGANIGTFPKACAGGPLTPQEKVLEFMLFDVAACVQPDSEPPSVFKPPPAAPPPPPPYVP